MRAVPSSLLAAAQKLRSRPVAYLDIWQEQGLLAVADQQGDWDNAIASSNVDTARVSGSVVLAPGAAHTVAGASSWTQVAASSWTGTGAAGVMVTNYGPINAYPFAAITQTVDDARMPLLAGISYPTGVNPILPYGAIVHIWADIWIADAAGNQIGNRIRKQLMSNGSRVSPTVTLIQGLGAALTRGQTYQLCVQGVSYGGVYAGTANAHAHIYAAYIGDESNPNWRVPVSGYPNVAFPLGGDEAYAATGSITVQLDLGSTPTTTGAIYMDDVRPLGTSLSYQAQYSDDGATWSSMTAVASGDPLAAHRYWRVQANLTANSPDNDYTPEVQAIRIEMASATGPTTLATHATSAGVERALSGVSAFASQLSPKVKGIIQGEIQCTLAPQRGFESLASQNILGGRRARVRVGYADVADTLDMYTGTIRELTYSRNRYTLTVRDATDLAGAEVPQQPYPAWNSANTYNTGDKVSYKHRGYSSLAASNTGNQPDTSPSWWQDLGGVWQPADYSGGVHLADCALDILRNYTSLRDDQIDIAAFDAIKADPIRAGRTSNRIITKPQKALDLLAEIALLLECQWLMRGDKLSLAMEPEAGAPPVETITSDDLAEGLSFRKGWKDIANIIFVLSSYNEAAGDGSQAFSSGYVQSDADSLDQFGAVTRRIEDRWGMPTSEVEALAGRLLTRWAGGRAVVSCRAAMRLERLEPGDVVTLISDQLPPDVQTLTMMVTRVDLDWQRQSLNLTLLEVT